ncbi:MAG: ThiF family adenylyltransferase [Pseudolactococcus laudensis]
MKRFRLKSELIWMQKESGIETYYGNNYLNTVINTDDNEGFFSFLQFINIPRTDEEIVGYGLISQSKKDDILLFLENKGYGYWISGTVEALTRTEMFVNTFPKKFYQDYEIKVSEQRIIIIGLGTAGCYLVEILGKLKFNHFVLIDGDSIEEKNLEAQNYLVNEIGKYKVEALNDRYGEKYQITPHKKFIANYQELNGLVDGLTDTDIIINASDDHELMLDLIQAKVDNKISGPILVSGYGVLAQTAYLIKNYQTAIKFIDRIKILIVNKKGAISENSGSVLNSFLGTYMVSKLLLDYMLEKESVLAYGNFETNEIHFDCTL